MRPARRVLPQSIRRGNRRFMDHLLLSVCSDIMRGWEFNPDLELYWYNAWDATATRSPRQVLSPAMVEWIGELVRRGCRMRFDSIRQVTCHVMDGLGLAECDITIAAELLRRWDEEHPGWYSLAPKPCKALPGEGGAG